MLARTGMVVLIAAGALAAADKPSQEILELQRDVAQLQEMVKTLGQSMEQRAAAMNGAIQGIAASVEKVNASVASLQKGTGDVAPTIATQGVRIDQAGQSLNQVQQAVADLTAAVNKLQTQVGDIGNAVKAMAAPPAGPPGTEKPRSERRTCSTTPPAIRAAANRSSRCRNSPTTSNITATPPWPTWHNFRSACCTTSSNSTTWRWRISTRWNKNSRTAPSSPTPCITRTRACRAWGGAPMPRRRARNCARNSPPANWQASALRSGISARRSGGGGVGAAGPGCQGNRAPVHQIGRASCR